MIKKLRVKNFKALRDIEIELTPIHVLIGPNDSGKTSIIDVLVALCRSMDHVLSNAFLGSWKGSELVWAGSSELQVGIHVHFDDDRISEYALNLVFGKNSKQVLRKTEEIWVGKDKEPILGLPRNDRTSVKYHFDTPTWESPNSEQLKALHELLRGVHYYHWNPEFLALPVAADSKRRFRMESNGFGLALCLDEILSYDRRQFIQLEERFIKIFPHIKSIKLQQEPAYRAPVDNPDQVTMLNRADGKGLYFELKDSGQLVPASQASDGTLLILAYLSVLYLPEPPRLLLVEEPENGIHPKRLHDVLRILQDLVKEQSHTQIILTTHSPYVLDLFKPEEVTLCTKLDTGEIRTTRLSESSKVKEQMDIFTLGEIWTSEDDDTIAQSGHDTKGTV